MKAGDSFSYRVQKIKFQFQCTADHKTLFSVMQGERKTCQSDFINSCLAENSWLCASEARVI